MRYPLRHKDFLMWTGHGTCYPRSSPTYIGTAPCTCTVKGPVALTGFEPATISFRKRVLYPLSYRAIRGVM